MSKIIPKFYLPKDYPEDMRLLAEALIKNNGEDLKSVVTSLTGKMISHTGKTAGQPMSETTIKNYLCGFSVLDLFSSDNLFYSDRPPSEKVFLSVKSKIRVKQDLAKCLDSLSSDSFNEILTQLCSEQSLLVRHYNDDINLLKEQYNLSDTSNLSLLQEMLVKHCNYSYVGNPGVGYLNIFYKDKIEIDSYLKLMDFILNKCGNYARENMGLVPISEILKQLRKVCDYHDDEIKKFLIKLKITNRIELRMTKTQLAKNLGIELVDIQGVEYGFLKIINYSLVS